MFSPEQYRARAAEYLQLAANSESSNKVYEFRDLARITDQLSPVMHQPCFTGGPGSSIVAPTGWRLTAMRRSARSCINM
jgi:hypothetical protein